MVDGWVAPGFGGVQAAFEENFRDRGEVGAAFAAYADGILVVDLWGGVSDARCRRPWESDTLQLVFSGAKGLLSAAILLLVQRGALQVDMPVSSYWPEFAAAGKGRLRVRHVLDHTAGLPGVSAPIEDGDVLDGRGMADLLAAQRPCWTPGARLSYHALSFGWLLGELIRRVDGRTAGRFVREEISAPLELDTWIGLPAEHERRMAHTTRRLPGGGAPETLRARILSDKRAWSVWNNPPLFYGDRFVWNDARFHAAEIPAVNAITTARSMARFYSRLLVGDSADKALLEPALLHEATSEQSRGSDPFSHHPFRFGLGFQLQNAVGQFGPSSLAFGHGGAGGSIHGAWPESGVAFSYVMNQMRGDLRDARALTLLDALSEAVPAYARPGRP